GRLELTGISLLDGAARGEVLRLAGAVEAASEHPVGRAVARAAHDELGELPAGPGFRSEPGVGVRGGGGGRRGCGGRGGGGPRASRSWGRGRHERRSRSETP